MGFARKGDSVLAEVDLRDLAGEAVQLAEREAANKDIEIVFETVHSENRIWSDPYQLRQVLLNLLTNAIYATAREGKISIKLESTDDEAAFTIKDTGQGIPKENLERIFEPFFSTKPPGEGTGLGLFVTRGIVEKLGGSIKVESRLGMGASFCVKLPKCFEVKEGISEEHHTDVLDKMVKMD